ncbi:hypothetical protein MKQ70_15325 [Chitinophaga sedimenti]|uniref:hypothetical protein n=1 Tax=Chitinophaga sedimenti TaxID=2033606 RepID=UPI00200520FB|nr:hypothetical protein [Chitinophaga sedimenti]MCK7556313.1 hypothetical protein [Chitinophaga sedimenti]
MKQQFFYILAMAAGLTSCSKNWVDTKPTGEPTTAFFWKSDEDLEKATAALYVPMKTNPPGAATCSGYRMRATTW